MEVSKTVEKYSLALLVLGLIAFGIGWRMVPHLPNFAPIGALALLGGVAFHWRTALWMTLGIVGISDLLIGTYSGIQWTWLSYGLIIGLGVMVKNLPLAWRLPIGALSASLLFFVASNFGTWVASGMYTHTIAGFMQCYVMALPFYKATLISDMLFGGLVLGIHAVFSSKYSVATVRYLHPESSL